DAFRNFRAFLPELRSTLFDRSYLPAAPKGYPDAWRTPRRWSPDTVSPFEAMRILDPKPSMGALKIVQDRFAAAFPALGRPEIVTAWGGMIDTMPDVLPIIDHAPALPGLVVATGMSGHGFGIGPAIGRVVADLVTGGALGHDLAPFRMARFAG
ncbi:MAG: FAD-binding oxidoreductase, partial [Paracoccaceae bacterium]|nr:FAD-binding oxidoreductase [Paracoccaceae bacterium]